jgi:Acyl-CoA carboxylase epsilon subunit
MDDGRPLLAVVRGDASEEEIAALVTVLAARNRAAGQRAAARRRPVVSAWADRSAQLRKPLRPGPGGWRASARPGSC